MKNDFVTKGLLLFVGSGLWAVAASNWTPTVTAAAPPKPSKAAPNVPNVVRAKRFELIGPDGKVRGVIEADNVVAGIKFQDRKGNVDAALGTDDDGPKLLFYGKDKKKRATLETDFMGTALKISDKNGTTRAMLTVTDGPLLVLLDAKRKTIYKAPR